MTSSLKKLPGGTLEFTITIAWSQVKGIYDKIFALLLAEVELPGFRKGKAPLDLAVKQIDSAKVYEEVLKELLPQVYAEAVKEHAAHPIISPKVEVVEAAENKDWKVRAITCEKPEIVLGNYHKAISDLHASKKVKIWLPGENKTEDAKENEVTIGELLDALSKTITVTVSPILLEQEVNRMLSNLLNQTQKLGLTVDDYLRSQNKTTEQLRSEYTKEAEKTLGMEFALEEIADSEKVTVDESEIDTIINNAKTPDEKQNLQNQRYYIASVLRRQKTLQQLLKPRVIKA